MAARYSTPDDSQRVPGAKLSASGVAVFRVQLLSTLTTQHEPRCPSTTDIAGGGGGGRRYVPRTQLVLKSDHVRLGTGGAVETGGGPGPKHTLDTRLVGEAQTATGRTVLTEQARVPGQTEHTDQNRSEQTGSP